MFKIMSFLEDNFFMRIAKCVSYIDYLYIDMCTYMYEISSLLISHCHS